MEFLKDLPSRGTLTSVQAGSAFVSTPVLYIAAHNTAPPPNQVVKTDPTSLLIKSLQSRKAREEANKKKPASAAKTTKRSAGDAAAGDAAEGSKPPTKKGPAAAGPSNAAPDASGAGPSNTSAQAGPSTLPANESAHTVNALKQRTIKDLQTILKAWGLPISGKKDDLAQRIFEHQELSQGRGRAWQ